MRGLTGLIPALPLFGACATGVASPTVSEGTHYTTDVAYRRTELLASLVNPSNGYSSDRIAHYAGGDFAWDELPEWNPRVDLVAPNELDDGTAVRATLTNAAEALDLSAGVDDEGAMRALGERAFFRYPVQLEAGAAIALTSRATASSYGLWVDEGHAQVGGLVRAEVAGGSVALAMTCASCHVRSMPSALVVGDGSDSFDLGRLLADAANFLPGSGSPLLSWGPGRVDVTTSDGSVPERIPDLRPVKWLAELQQEATLDYRDRTMLAIRLETLMITSHGAAVRPPRLVAWAIATYIESLAETLPALR